MTPVRAPDVVRGTDLRDLPALLSEAERLAAEHHTALARVINRTDLATQAPTLPAWEHLSPSYREMRVEAHLDLLTDLTRPASRDAVARLVAAKLGWLFGALVNDLESGRPAALVGVCREVGVADPGTVTDPAEALRLIALHVLRSPDV